MAGKLASRVRGLSEAQFREAYGTEERCRAVVEKLRWPKGFVCPRCGGCEGEYPPGPHLRPEGRRGDDKSVSNSCQRRSGLSAVPPRDSMNVRTRSFP